MTLAEGIGFGVRFARLILYVVEVPLRYFGISRRPHISCDLVPVEIGPLPLFITAQFALVRQHWIGDIDKIPECRVRLSWYPINKLDDVTTAAGVWGETAMPPFKPIRTLTENDPLNFVPLFAIQSRPNQIKWTLGVDRLYVTDGMFMAQENPTHMLKEIESGIYWFMIDLLRGRKPPISFKWLLSISPGARSIRIEPAFEMLTTCSHSLQTINRPVGGPTEVVVTPLFSE
jgi:hypothetical protein